MRLIIIALAAILATDGASAAPGQKLCVKGDRLKNGLEVKAAPSADAETIMTIGAGRVVIEFEREEGWVFVGVDRAGGRDGYVPEDALSSKDLDGMNCGS